MAKSSLSESKRKSKVCCVVPWCEKPVRAGGYCNRHNHQVRQHKAILLRTSRDPNNFEIDGDICHVSLYNRRSIKTAETIIDAEDAEKCKAKKWCLNNGYVISGVHPNAIRLQNFLLNHKANPKTVIDHINRNPLDNRRKNLRLASISQNIINSKLHCDNTSGYRGVCWEKRRKKWQASIMVARRQVYLGYFVHKEDAINKRKEAAKRFHSGFAGQEVQHK